MRHSRTFLPLGIAAVLLVSACSSDDDSSTTTESLNTTEQSVTSAADSTTGSTPASSEIPSDSTGSTDGSTSGSTSGSGDDSTADSSVDEEYFTIEFDGEPTVGTLDAETVGAASTTRTVTLENGDYEAVAETDIPDPAATSLDGMVEGTRQSVNGEDPVVETISLNGWEGRRWSFPFEQGGLAGTYYAVGAVVGDKLLQVGYIDGGSDNQQDAEAFLDSLQVLTSGPG